MARTPPRTKAIDKGITLTPEEIAFVKAMVIHEDPEILVFNKPTGLSSQGGRGQVHTLDELMWAFAKSSGSRPRLIHRLDRDTSGVILTARSKPAAGFLGKALMAKKFRKTYHALVAPGAPDPKQGEIAKALRREEIGREAYMRICPDDHPDAEPSLTRYRTLAANDEAALVELEPVTGRMHQLRVHLASIGRPIVGDVRYGGQLTLGGQPAGRLMLHAAKLRFPHPAGETSTVEAPWPEEFAQAVEAAGLT